MKHNQVKNRILSGIFLAGTDFEKSKKNLLLLITDENAYGICFGYRLEIFIRNNVDSGLTISPHPMTDGNL